MNRSISSSRGAILIHVAIAIFVLIGVLAFVFDYGVMWVGRGQAQNAADAGALAGAVAMAFDNNGWTDRSATGPARTAAQQTALSNYVWGQAPDVQMATDVFFTPSPADMCPPDPAGLTPCIRVDVYRNVLRGNPLPMFFGMALGLTQQGVRATATARVAVADASDCMKPWAIPDKWEDWYDVTIPIESNPQQWLPDDTFETADRQGNTWTPLNPPDVYTPPSSSSPGTGFTVAIDLGTQLVLKEGSPSQSPAPGVFFPVQLPLPGGGFATGAADYEATISGCNSVPVKIDDVLNAEPGVMIGPTKHGVNDLIAQDPGASWDTATDSVVNSCAQAATPCAAYSPRIVAIPVFDTATYFTSVKMNGGQAQFKVVNILGFFIDRIQGNDVFGYLTEAPGLTTGNGTITPAAAFLSQIQLVR